jgi:D-glycero-D-manno-heptose 1,7-bisphosphate phosphatase
MIDRHSLDPVQCYMVGDNVTDNQTALNAGIHSILVRTGKVDPGSISEIAEQQIPVFDDIAAFVATLA